MARAQRLSWLAIGLAALAASAALASALTVLSRLDFSVPAVNELMDACTRLLPSLGASSAPVLALLALLGVVLLRAGRAVAEQVSSERALSRRLPLVGSGERRGVRFRLVAGDSPQAFCAGMLTPRIYLSEGAVRALSARELEAVLAHEDHHRRRRDPLRLAAGAVVAHAFFFVPALARLDERYRTMAELAADEAAVRRTDATTLASALLRFAPTRPSVAVGIAPERVDHLLGEPPRWDLPVLVLVGSLAALALLVAFAAAATEAAGTVNVPMALMGSCGVLMVVAALGAVITAALVVARRRRA